MQAHSLLAETGVVLVDHGSKNAEANDMLLRVAQAYRKATGAAIVEPAHMELAEPTIEQAFERCVEQGARLVIVHPYFLSPGRHSTTDIPHLAAQAASNHPGIAYRVTEPLGLDPRMTAVIQRRVKETLDTLDT